MKKTWIIVAAFCVWGISASAQIVCPLNSRDNLASSQNAPNQSDIIVSGMEPSAISLYHTANPNRLGLQAEQEALPITSAPDVDFADTTLVPKYTAHVPEPPSILAAMALLLPLSVSLLRVLRKKEAP